MDNFTKRFNNEWEKYYQKQLDNKNYYISKDVFKREFREKLICNNELDFITVFFKELWDFSFNYNNEMLLYLKCHKNEIKHEQLINIYKVILSSMLCFSDFRNNLNSEEIFVLNELYKRNLSIFDTLRISQGSNSSVFQIDNTILKFGKRECKKIPDNSRIFYPEYKGNLGKNYFEITRKLNVKNCTSLNSTLFEIYCELRNQNVIWLDPKALNIAKLTKADIDIYNQNKEVKYKNDITHNPCFIENELHEGDYVIIDLDLMYPEKKRYEAGIEYLKLNNELQDTIKEFDRKYQRIKK